MIATECKNKSIKEDSSKLELYALLGEGYQAMQEGRECNIEDVKERIAQRRKERDRHSFA